MTYEFTGSGALDYAPCRYGCSKLLFRGPRRSLAGEFCLALGGSETYGKFVEHPWPALLERRLQVPVVNLGYLNAGPDLFAHEPFLSEVTRAARMSVIQLMGAANMSNRFYAVHPRRNDRFLRASALMRDLFPGADFAEFSFTRHMLESLHDQAPEAFARLASELQATWVSRMRTLLDRIDGPKVILWLRDYHTRARLPPLGSEPALVTGAMVDHVRPYADLVVEVTPSPAARQAGLAGMVFPPTEAPAAADMPGPRIHEEVAEALAPVITKLL